MDYKALAQQTAQEILGYYQDTSGWKVVKNSVRKQVKYISRVCFLMENMNKSFYFLLVVISPNSRTHLYQIRKIQTWNCYFFAINMLGICAFLVSLPNYIPLVFVTPQMKGTIMSMKIL